ncbi:hypothetical protein [Sphingomonas oryzagri]
MRKALLGALVATVLITGSAYAADPAPPPAADPARAAAERADDMTLLLGLRPDQRPALDQLLQAMTPPDRDGGEDRSGWMQARMTAAQTFRATLAPEQQARFDALERLRHGMGGRGHWGGGQ